MSEKPQQEPEAENAKTYDGPTSRQFREHQGFVDGLEADREAKEGEETGEEGQTSEEPEDPDSEKGNQ